MQQLGMLHPSPIISFVVDFDCGMEVLNEPMKHRLNGETLFYKEHFEMWNQLARQVNQLSQEDKLIFRTVIWTKESSSIESVLTLLTHIKDHVLHKDIVTWEVLGQFIAEQEDLMVPNVLQGYFDYELLGKLKETDYGMLTAGGFVQVVNQNSLIQAEFSSKYVLTDIMVCGECGQTYQR